LQFAGLRLIGWDFWTVIPKGDMPRWTCVILEVLDRVGRMCRLGACPGGLILTATRDVWRRFRSRTGAHSQWL